MIKSLLLIEAIQNRDWVELLKYYPQGVEIRGDKYNTPADFSEWDSYETYARYVSPAQNLMIERCLDILAGYVQQD